MPLFCLFDEVDDDSTKTPSLNHFPENPLIRSTFMNESLHCVGQPKSGSGGYIPQEPTFLALRLLMWPHGIIHPGGLVGQLCGHERTRCVSESQSILFPGWDKTFEHPFQCLPPESVRFPGEYEFSHLKQSRARNSTQWHLSLSLERGEMGNILYSLGKRP